MIRPATPQDEPAIRACARAAYQPYVALIGKEPAPMSADYTVQIAQGHVYVYQDVTGEIAGYIVFLFEDDFVLLENVAVFPEAKGRGVGKALIAFCEDKALANGANSIKLYTNEKMAQNLLIYPRLGYVETERRSENGFNRVYFEKLLCNQKYPRIE